MGMLLLHGQVINVFDTPQKVDLKTGEVKAEAAFRIQVMGEDELENGQKKMELVDLKVTDPSVYRGLVGKHILQPVGIMVDYASKKKITYALKGSKPKVIPASVPG